MNISNNSLSSYLTSWANTALGVDATAGAQSENEYENAWQEWQNNAPPGEGASRDMPLEKLRASRRA